MNRHHIHSIFEHTEHPDESTLWLYSRGELPRKEMHKVEQHLIDCHMCSDVVEGYSMYESQNSLDASINRSYFLFERSLKQKTKRKILRIAIAAVFVMVAVSTVVLTTDFLSEKTKKGIYVAEQNDKNIKNSDNDIVDGTVLKEDTSIGGLAVNRQEKEKQGLNKKRKADDVLPQSEPVVDDKKVKKETIDDTNLPETDKVTDAEISENADSESTGQQSDIEVPTDVTEGLTVDDKDSGGHEEKETSLVMAEQAEMDTGVKIGDKNRKESDMSYQEDRNILDREQDIPSVTAIAKDKKTTESANNETEKNNYQQGLEAKNQGKMNKALRFFARVEKGNESYWNAKWQIASIYRNRGDTVKARKVYSEIKDTNNPHQHSAEFFFNMLNPEDQ